MSDRNVEQEIIQILKQTSKVQELLLSQSKNTSRRPSQLLNGVQESNNTDANEADVPYTS